MCEYMVTKVVYPGSFDPLTKGHLDIIKKASTTFPKVVVAILVNHNKKSLFTVNERIKIIEKTLEAEKLNNVEVRYFEGMLVDFMKQEGITTSIRGLRSSEDFIYEQRIDMTNKKMWSEFRTVYFNADLFYLDCSSSVVRELLALNGDISNYVHENVQDYIKELYSNK